MTDPDAWRFELPGSIHNPHFAEDFEFSKALTRENVEPLYTPETILEWLKDNRRRANKDYGRLQSKARKSNKPLKADTPLQSSIL